MQVNMNHAATSATKPQAVTEALTAYLLKNSHQSVSRGSGELASTKIALEARIALAALFGIDNPSHIIFTSGATESLNMAIHGLMREGCHILATSLEHNAVARPLHLLREQGRAEVTFLPCDAAGGFDPQSVCAALRPNTRLLVMTHASNVLGNILPVEEAFALAKQHGLITILDAAQSVGHIPVMLGKNTDVIAFAGHKGLRGLAGTGGLVLSAHAAKSMRIWKTGGTGSHSHLLTMPDFLPDKFEAGTPNTLGIVSLHAAVRVLLETGLEQVRAHEMRMTERFVTGIKKLPLQLCGRYHPEEWVPVVSLLIPQKDAGVLARRLMEEFSIETRSGLHCAPLAHQSIGTFPAGTLRFSFGADTTASEIDYALDALKQLTAE